MEEKLYKTPVNLAGGEERFVCPQSLVLNSYLGCQHDCVYCYARYILEIFGKWKNIIPADVEIVEKTMKKAFEGKGKDKISELIRRKTPFRFANITDPLMEHERQYKATYRILEILQKYDYPVIINTKGTIGADDEYIKLMKKFPVVYQMTIPYENSEKGNDLGLKLEPKAPLVTDRYKALKKISDAGIITQVRYSPVYPKLNDNPERIFKDIKKAGAKDVICEFVRIPFQKKYLDLLNGNLGYDYLEYLKKEKYPMVKTKSWFKVEKPFIFEEYERFKKIAEKEGLNFYVCCEERPEINNWENCCGVGKYKGFENGMDWTIQMNGKKFKGGKEIDFEKYIEGTDCSYKEDFRKFYEEGKLKNNLYGLEFNDKKYKRK